MNKLNNLLKRFLLCFVVFACFMSNSLLWGGVYKNFVHAVSLNYIPSKLSVSTSFDTNSSSFPASVNNWTSIGESSDTVIKGIISTDEEDYGFESYEKSTKLNFNPGTKNVDDNNILMINTTTHAKTGFKTDVIELEEKSFYHISVDVYTVSGMENLTNSFASVKITGDNFSSNENAYYPHIQTNNTWQTVNFYIASDNLSTQEINLELRLGNNETFSYGVVFFDNFVVERLSNSQFVEMSNKYNGKMTDTIITNIGGVDYEIINYISMIDISNSNNYQDISTINPSFENGLNSWTRLDSNESITGVYPIGLGSFDYTSLKTEDPTNAFKPNNNKALLINNTKETSIGYKSSLINIARHRVYALSVDVKTGDNAQATLNLVLNNTTGSDKFKENKTAYTGITTSSENTTANGGWETYTFYIKGNFATNSEVYLELWLGGDSDQKGYVWFDSVTLQEITYEEYNNGSTKTNSKVVNLATDDDSLLVNGFFNNVTSAEIGGILTPNNWTVSTNTANTSNVTATIVDKDEFINVLRFENKVKTGSMITSEEISIDKSSYHELSFDAKIEDISEGRTAYAAIYDGTNLIYTLPLNADTYQWTHYSVALRNADFSKFIKIALCLGGMEDDDFKTKGIVYFDNVKFNSIEGTDFENSENTVDLKSFVFDNDFDKVNDLTDTKLLTSLSYTTSLTNDQIEYGILDLDNFDRIKQHNFTSITENPKSNNGNYVYVINSSKDAYHYVQTKSAYEFNASTYYKFNISVKTVNLGQDADSVAEKDPIPYGAFVSLEGIEGAKFMSIDTSNVTANNGYVTYTIYVNCVDATSVNIRFGLGQESSKTKGALFVENINLEISDSASFDSAKEDKDKNTLCVTASTIEQKEEEPTPVEPENKVDFNFLIIPTLITALALIIAIVGTLIRKYGKKPSVKVKNEYDRTSVEKSHNLREAITDKENNLKILNEKLESAQIDLNNLQPTVEMTDEEININKQKMYEIENQIGVIKEDIAQAEKEINHLKNQLNKL